MRATQSPPENREAGRCHLHALPVPPVSMWMSLDTHLLPWFCGCYQKDISLTSLALTARGACVHAFSGTVANRDSSWLAVSPGLITEGAVTNLPVFLRKWCIYILLKTAAWGYSLAHLGADWDPPFGNTESLGTSSAMGKPLRTKSAWKSQKCRDSQELGPVWMESFISDSKPLLQGWMWRKGNPTALLMEM